MKQFFFSIIFFITLNASSQNSTKDPIVGNWKIEKAYANTTNNDMKAFAKSFTNSTFSFQANHDFIFTTNEKSQVMQIFIQQFKNKKWLFDKTTKKYRIGDNKDRFTSMAITAKFENDKAFIELDETEMKMELVKMK